MAESLKLTRERRTLPARTAYVLAASVIGLGMFASVTPSPLYHTYSVLWDFSSLTLTLIYATYAFGVLTTLLLAGRLSDVVGRRPVLLAALATLMGSTVLFMFADSAAWLFVARGLQGLATGAALSAASAALLDLHPRRDPTGVALTNGVVSATGLGLGILVSSSLVQLGTRHGCCPTSRCSRSSRSRSPAPSGCPSRCSSEGASGLMLERPSVPAVVRRPFMIAGLAVLSSWSIGGLFFSLGPELSAHLFGSTNVIVSGIGIVALGLSAALAQVLLGRTAPWIGASAGSIALAAGMLLIVAAAATDSSSLYLVGSVIGGVGFGVAFLGGLRSLVSAIPHEHRAAVMSAFYIVAYASLSVPAVLAGIVVDHLGLLPTFETFGSVVSAIALIVAFEAWRSRPAALDRMPHRAPPVRA